VILTRIKKLPEDDQMMIEIHWSGFKGFECEILIKVSLKKGAFVGPLHRLFSVQTSNFTHINFPVSVIILQVLNQLKI
jgi:hypothetical protein